MAAETRVCRRVKYSAPVGIRLVRTDSDRARIRILGTLLHVTLELILQFGQLRHSARTKCRPQQARELLAPVYGWFTEGGHLMRSGGASSGCPLSGPGT